MSALGYPANNPETVASEFEQIIHYRVLAHSNMDMSPVTAGPRADRPYS
jgi:hypothetical protein